MSGTQTIVVVTYTRCIYINDPEVKDMAKQQDEGVYLYIDDGGSRYIAVVDAFGEANMIPWKQPGETANVLEKSWNLQGQFIKLTISQ